MQGRKTALKSHCYFLFTLSPITSKKKKKNHVVTVQKHLNPSLTNSTFKLLRRLFQSVELHLGHGRGSLVLAVPDPLSPRFTLGSDI